MIWTCRHCEHGIGGCPIHPERWPTATSATCASFYRAPGSDDEMPGRRVTRTPEAISEPGNTKLAGRCADGLEVAF